MSHLWWPPVDHRSTGGPTFLPTGGPPVATTKWVTATMVATGGAAMGNAVATGGLPWVVSTGFHNKTLYSKTKCMLLLLQALAK